MSSQKTNQQFTRRMEHKHQSQKTDSCTYKCTNSKKTDKKNACNLSTPSTNHSRESKKPFQCIGKPKNTTQKPCTSHGRRAKDHETPNKSKKDSCAQSRHKDIRPQKEERSSMTRFLKARRGKDIEFIYLLEKPLVLVKPQLPVSTLSEQKPPVNPLEVKFIPQRAKYLEAYEKLGREAEKKRPPCRPSSRMERLCRIVKECRKMHDRFASIIQQNHQDLQASLCGASCQVIEILESQLDKEIRTQDKEHSLLEDDPRIAAELAKMEKGYGKDNYGKVAREEATGALTLEAALRPYEELFEDATQETENGVEDVQRSVTLEKLSHVEPKKSLSRPKNEAQKNTFGELQTSKTTKVAFEQSLDLWDPPTTTATTKLEEAYSLSKLYFLMKVRQNRSTAIETNFDEMLHEDDADRDDRANQMGFNELIRRDRRLH